MTETIESMPTRTDQLQLAQALVEQAPSEGVELIGRLSLVAVVGLSAAMKLRPVGGRRRP